jgi:hypothetical protein
VWWRRLARRCLTVDLGAPCALEALRIDGLTPEERSYIIFYIVGSASQEGKD